MDAKIIAQKKKDRYHKALAIAATAGAIRKNGQPHTYYVTSQSGNGRYLAATPEAVAPLGMCSCSDFQSFGKYNGIPCKHICSAHIFEQARAYVLRHIERYDLTPQRVVDLASHPVHNPTEQSDLRLRCIVTAAAIIRIELQAEKEAANA